MKDQERWSYPRQLPNGMDRWSLIGSGLYNTCLLPNQIRIVNKRVLYTFIEAGIIHRGIYK